MQDLTYRPFGNHIAFVKQKFGVNILTPMHENEFVAYVRNNPELKAAYVLLRNGQLTKNHEY
jgi:hypothetical protein